jgi:preprotein translocase subunit SecE
MKWFSLSGIMTEVKRIRWPKTEEMVKNSVTVIVVTVLFGIYFVIAQAVVAFFLQMIGV